MKKRCLWGTRLGGKRWKNSGKTLVGTGHAQAGGGHQPWPALARPIGHMGPVPARGKGGGSAGWRNAFWRAFGARWRAVWGVSGGQQGIKAPVGCRLWRVGLEKRWRVGRKRRCGAREGSGDHSRRFGTASWPFRGLGWPMPRRRTLRRVTQRLLRGQRCPPAQAISLSCMHRSVAPQTPSTSMATAPMR
jgi:hypothetical protein